jgi:hypothetical protein
MFVGKKKKKNTKKYEVCRKYAAKQIKKTREESENI